MSTTAQKLEYLGTTKSQLKDMINYGLPNEEQIDSSTTFRNYVSSIFKAFLESLNNPKTLFNNLPKVTGNGTNIILNNTAEAGMIIELEPSDISQDGTPTPDSPQDIHTISGSNKVVVRGKQLWDEVMEYGGYSGGTGEKVSTNYQRNANYILIPSNTELTLSKPTGKYTRVYFYDKNKTFISAPDVIYTNRISSTFTTPSNAVYMNIQIDYGSSTYNNDILIEIGNSATDYEPYVSQTADVNLGVENLCKSQDLKLLINSDGTTTSYNDAKNVIINTTNINNLYISGDYSILFGSTVRIGLYNTYPAVGVNGTRLLVTTGQAIDCSNYNYVMVGFNTTSTTTEIDSKFKIILGNKDQQVSDTPIEYCKIGNYKDKFIRTSGKNLLDVGTTSDYTAPDYVSLQIVDNSIKGKITDGGASFITKNESYYINKFYITANYDKNNSTPRFLVKAYDSNNTQITSSVSGWTYNSYYGGYYKDGAGNFDLSSASYVKIGFAFLGTANDTGTYTNIMITTSTDTSYEPYGTDEWYLKKNIGKVVLDGSESWYVLNMPNVKGYQFSTANLNMKINTSDNNLTGAKLTILQEQTPTGNYISTENTKGFCINTSSSFRATLGETTADLQGFKDMLAEKLPLLIYQLATPTYTKIEGTLAEQLEDIYQYCKSYKGTTNISQINNDLPFVFNVSALEDISNL